VLPSGALAVSFDKADLACDEDCPGRYSLQDAVLESV
jgi:hypothetical protein